MQTLPPEITGHESAFILVRPGCSKRPFSIQPLGVASIKTIIPDPPLRM